MTGSIFALTTRHADWVAQRRAVLAGNIAHADTPGYQAVDIKPFEVAMQSGGPGLTQTDRLHLSSGGAFHAAEVGETGSSEAKHSGNTVDIEQELLKSGEVTRAHLLNVSIVRAFHRMSLLGVKG